MRLASFSEKKNYLVIGDTSWPVESIKGIIPQKAKYKIFIDGKGWLDSKSKKNSHKFEQSLEALSFPVDDSIVAIVGFSDLEKVESVVHLLKNHFSKIQFLRLGGRKSSGTLDVRRSVAWKDLLSEGLQRELDLLSLQKDIQKIKSVVKDAEEVAILIQDDPDPDSLAGALALRKIMNRKSQTAPIVSFGNITRPENLAMARLLDIEVIKVDELKLASYAKIAYVDCQPSFFKGREVTANIVIDHHPETKCAALDGAELVIINEKYGSVSSLFTFYMQAAGIEISQRLATALLYGVKSDTLFFNRPVSERDLEAFVTLYPLTNGSLLRRIERPDLPLNYLSSLRKGLKYLKVQGEIAVMPLPEIKKEEWIPQSADFISQIEGVDWAVSGGVYEDKVIFSGRHWGHQHHCGDLFEAAFLDLGSAGGHKSMAKAVIPKKVWDKKFGDKATSPATIKKVLIRKIKAYLKSKS